MNPLALSVSSRWLVLSLLAATPSAALAADLVLKKAPPLTVRQAPAYPENLARYHFGADVHATPQSVPLTRLQLSFNGQDQNMSEAALLCDDPTTGYELPAGASSLSISLSTIENVESVAFVNLGAQGNFDIAVSNADLPAANPVWRSAGKGSLTSGAVVIKIGPGEAKYLKIRFNLTRAGRIAAFGVYATPALSDFTMPRPRKVSFEESSPNFALINFNFSDLHLKARGVYASSGDLEQISNMIDDQAATAYQFAKSDAEPTAVIDLGRERSLSRLCALYAEQPGLLEFYVLRDLPNVASSQASEVRQVANVGQSAGLPSSLEITDRTLAGFERVGSVVNRGEGRASINFPEVAGRYLMLKWHPADAPASAFSIAQVAAFGPTKRSATGPNAEDGKDGFDGKSILDKEGPEALGEGEAQPPGEGPPPSLPPVPPFTFIPQAPPTSP